MLVTILLITMLVFLFYTVYVYSVICLYPFVLKMHVSWRTTKDGRTARATQRGVVWQQAATLGGRRSFSAQMSKHSSWRCTIRHDVSWLIWVIVFQADFRITKCITVKNLRGKLGK